ncbi:MAG: PKD domain-containing protein, partial [Bacteroidales bacterium]|nr:PKD domain-containing protein [Bacteroidales bacterium]
MKNLLLNIFILSIICRLNVSAQSNFSATHVKGCDTLTTQFLYNNFLAATSYKWTFGDGSESTEASPQHKYNKPGKYLVSVKINGTDSVGKADYILIGKTPKAEFTFRDTMEYGSYTMAFNPSSQTATEFPYSYSWNFSDGATSSSPYFVHQFDTTGNYTAQLIITDTQGCADTIIKAVKVQNKLDVPTVFTPNDDAINDLFIVEGDGKTTYLIQIFSRSGIKVFENKAKVLVWDGRMFS